MALMVRTNLLLVLLFVFPNFLYAEVDLSLENTNILFFTDEVEDSNRFRVSLHYLPDSDSPISGTLVVDTLSNYLFRDNSSEHDVEIYRGYIEYQGEQANIKLGKQRIPFGVGRIWNPVDIFNPIDITSPEPQEREGSDSLRLEYSPSALSSIDCIISDQRMALRYKTYYDSFDLGALIISDNENDILVFGWEFEGELLSSGLDIRSEGGYFHDEDEDKSHFDLIFGAEYGFPHGISLLVEYEYEDLTHKDLLAARLSAQISPLLYGSVLTIMSLDDQSKLFSTSLDYSLSDEMNLNCGVFSYKGEEGETFSDENMFFLRWFVHF